MQKQLEHKQTTQMSESLITIFFLALSGGLQDAYTYIARGGVFANAQTGNIVLLSANLLEGDRSRVLHYLIPLAFFSMGVLAAEWIRIHSCKSVRLHWRQLVVLCEIVLLFLVGVFPSRITLLANSLVSFSCAMQVQAFRKVDGYSFSSTMCIGDLRSGVEAFYSWHLTGDRDALYKAMRYFWVILFFALGAGLGAFMVPRLGIRTIWISCGLLTVCFILMFIGQFPGRQCRTSAPL